MMAHEGEMSFENEQFGNVLPSRRSKGKMGHSKVKIEGEGTKGRETMVGGQRNSHGR